MIKTEDLSGVTDGNVHGSDGEKIGSVGQVYLDNQSGQPAWVTVKTGLFGTKASFVPLVEATVEGKDLRVPYDKETIKHAPNVDADGELTPAEEDELYRYYDVDSGDQGHHGERGESGQAARGRDTDDAAAAGGAAGVAGHRPGEHEHGQHRQPRPDEGERREHDEAEHHQHGDGEHREHDENGEHHQHGDERRIRRYIVTEETVTRREEAIPSDEPHPR